MSTYNVIGIMSGTSLDGLDVCHCSFTYSSEKNSWDFSVHKATTIPHSKKLKNVLEKAISLSGVELFLLNNQLGDFFGNSINTFIGENGISKNEIDFIASHGHTVFHQPTKKLTVQIGNGANIAAITQLKVVCDFRSLDVALGGNGAPLVPIGDKLLFPAYDYCVNLGGIANISYESDQNRIAFDICPVNMVLNRLAKSLGLEFDPYGENAKQGKLNHELYEQLNQLEYYHEAPPKSLGYEWFETHILPLIRNQDLSVTDLLHTFVEHMAFQIGNQLQAEGQALFTGGGTHNSYLMERIKSHSNSKIIVPSQELIDFKEALIFGFLGTLRFREQENTLKSVTGASKNTIGGCIYYPFTKF